MAMNDGPWPDHEKERLIEAEKTLTIQRNKATDAARDALMQLERLDNAYHGQKQVFNITGSFLDNLEKRTRAWWIALTEKEKVLVDKIAACRMNIESKEANLVGLKRQLRNLEKMAKEQP